MRFSVIVPLYNKGPYLPATLASLRAQTLADFEAIVVDDGSSDNGPELARRCGDARVRLVQQPNGGVSVARNRGITEARGEWIAFLDADDWWHPQHLATLSRLIDKHPQVNIAGTAFRNVEHAADAAFSAWPLDAQPDRLIDDTYSAWHRGPLFFTSAVALRRSALLRQQPWFVPGESSGEDLDLWLRMAEASAVAFSPSTTVWRLLVPGNLSSRASLLHEPPFLARLEARVAAGDVPPRLAASAARFVADSRVSLSRACSAAGERAAGARWLWRARRHAGKRWCLALVMVLLPRGAAHRIHAWRSPSPQ